jgi:hypothetical protein
MTAYVEECRREWKRLGVPDLLADEMATDLEADLVEAQADGVSASEILGESDPRRFAASWAEERGLVPEPRPQKSRKRLWIVLAVILAVFLLFGGLAAFGLLATTSTNDSAPPMRVQPVELIHAVRVPSLVGLKACHAVRIATRARLEVQPHQSADLPDDAVVDGKGFACDAVVNRQRPAPGQLVRRLSQLTLWLGRASG